ncbi:MAG TPA: thioesterase family protein [Candidatus Gastranaerophilaceae bacterium]|nr:thioesterase family protein [Candidatus Gastranaerophilaceae bacterium]HPT41165.1 thioesterase family protein [Candidatus Gastranaerophilaceae bacterium]
MKNILEQKVYYSDTDAYGVVWHGSYLRWLEMGRVELCEDMGYNLIELENQDIVMPVVNINVRYKASAKINNELIITTKVKEFNSICVKFEQKITDKNSGKIFIEALVEVVTVNREGKLYRKMPQILTEAFEKAMKDEEYALK